MLELTWLREDNLVFPDVENALQEPNGLLAVGGDLSPTRLISAYQRGIFPWFNEAEPILWWSPSPRLVLFPDKLHCSRSLRKTINRKVYTVTADHCFSAVIEACAAPRAYTSDTWISAEMQEAYRRLHQLGYAHSVECWHENQLVGGLYGIQLDQVFFGESMFSQRTDASKVAFIRAVEYLRQQGCMLIDCQVSSEHLISLGAEEIDRSRFCDLLTTHITHTKPGERWQLGEIERD